VILIEQSIKSEVLWVWERNEFKEKYSTVGLREE